MMSPLSMPEQFGFHAKTVATWDGSLHRDVRLLVPVQVDALVVRGGPATFADCRMRTPAEAGSRLSTDLLPPPFADRPRDPGVHLQWKVPDALATLQASGSTATPKVLPDRWLVARIGPGASDRRKVTAWVVDARAATHTPLDAWTPAVTALPALTALGIGDAGWAAYYDNVVDRLGFYDPLTDVTAGDLAYLVCGWYADAAHDPLVGPMETLAAFEQRLASLGWDVPAEDLERARATATVHLARAALAGLPTPHASRTAKGDAVVRGDPPPLGIDGKPIDSTYVIADAYWPGATLFHGAIVGVKWGAASTPASDVGGPPEASSVDVALGTTSTDALAALVARATASTTEAAWLSAFAVGALEEIDRPDGPAHIDDHLHDSAFDARPDGSDRVLRKPSSLPPRTPPTGPKPPKSTGGVTGIGGITLGREAWAARTGTLIDAHAGQPEAPPKPEPTEVLLPRPRLFVPSDPVIAIQGARRSLRYGADGRFSPEGRLICRLSGTHVSSLVLRATAGGVRGAVRASDFLDRPLLHGAIPPECEDLLEETGLFDPASAPFIAHTAAAAVKGSAGALPTSTLARIAATEQTAWWTTRDPAVDQRAIVAHSGFEGRLPSAIAVRPATVPWVPMHLDWEVEYLPAPAREWTPGEIELGAPGVPSSGELFRGRALLSPGAATALAASVRAYVAQEDAAGTSAITDADRSDQVHDLADRLGTLDVLSGSLEHFHLALRRGMLPDAAPIAAPPGFVAVRAGFVRLKRLRLVDAFGRSLYLAGSARDRDADPTRVAIGAAADVPGSPGVLALPPRFTAPTKVSFRFRDAAAPAQDVTGNATPVAAFVLPDHLDGALELFDGSGNAIGQLRIDLLDGALWEPAPGTPTRVGASPAGDVTQPHLAGIAQSLFDRSVADLRDGRPPALTELLRAIDSTRWTVDPFGHVGEEHLSLLVGHPIAVVLASLQVEVREPATGTDVPLTRVPVRLGALTHWQDGLFGCFVDGNFDTFRVAAASAALARPQPSDGFLGSIDSVPEYAAQFASDVGDGDGATPIRHPYIDTSGILWVVPGVRYDLVLLVEPHCVVHATTCMLPRKSLALERDWIAPALARIAPTFRFGPVLRDPRQMRMPIASDVEGAWTWTHRADVDRWQEEEVVHAGQEALLPPDPAVGTEGWLKLTPAPGGGTGRVQ